MPIECLHAVSGISGLSGLALSLPKTSPPPVAHVQGLMKPEALFNQQSHTSLCLVLLLGFSNTPNLIRQCKLYEA